MKEYASIKTITQIVGSDFKINHFTLIHGLGHGVGLEIHERPFLSPKNDTFLKENMVITNEPGIYIRGGYGIRIEDTLVITKNGSIPLTNSAKNYTVI